MNESGLCKCGCGKRTLPYSAGNPANPRYLVGTPRDFLSGHGLHGVGSFRPGSLGLTFHKPSNRWKIICRNGRRTGFYRAVMEAHLGRELQGSEQVHHINGDTTDDRIENLRLHRNLSEHMRQEHSLQYLKAHAARRLPDEHFLQILREWIAQHGRVPTQKEFENDPDLPHSTTYFRRFGPWSKAITLAQKS